ncbi:MAG: ParA family protein [Deferrisomatales bacterium]
MKVLATYNVKGGVGKTTAAVNLAYLAARQGARTLVWDLDPQGAASYCFRVRPRVKGGARKLLKKKAGLEVHARATDYEHLDLVPADVSHRHLDLVLSEAKKPTARLARLLGPLAETYDYAFLDCAPSLSLVSEAVFEAADAVLVPTIPTPLSLRTLDQLAELRAEGGWGAAVWPFLSLVDRRKRLHRQLAQALPAERPELLRSQIPYASDVELMTVRREPLAAFAGASPAARAFEALWAEVRGRLEGTPET